MFEYTVVTDEEKNLLKYKLAVLKHDISGIVNRINQAEYLDLEELRSEIQFSLMHINTIESILEAI